MKLFISNNFTQVLLQKPTGNSSHYVAKYVGLQQIREAIFDCTALISTKNTIWLHVTYVIRLERIHLA